MYYYPSFNTPQGRKEGKLSSRSEEDEVLETQLNLDIKAKRNRPNCGLLSFLSFFAVLGLELRAYTLSHSTSPCI
jgi:hypothetical protein